MKRMFIKFIALIMTLIFILICSLVSSSAYGSYISASDKELDDLAYHAVHYFLNSFSATDLFTDDTIDNVQYWFDIEQNYVVLDEKYKTDEERQYIIDNFSKSMSTDIVISSDAILCLYEAVKNESNDNGYYSDELWNEFSKNREKVKMSIEEGIKPEDANNLFLDLRDSFNALCLSNQIMGDVNKDGRIDILDATIMQKGLVKKLTLNSSQLLISCNNTFPQSFSISNVTEWQKLLVKMGTIESNVFHDFYANDYNPICDKWDFDLKEYDIPRD